MALDLYKFKDAAAQRGNDYTKPPYRISAESLDRNFRKVSPGEQKGSLRPYTISETEDGWLLNPEILFDVCENGQPAKYYFVAVRAWHLLATEWTPVSST